MSARAKSVIFWMGREHPNRKTSWPLRSQGNSEAHSLAHACQATAQMRPFVSPF